MTYVFLNDEKIKQLKEQLAAMKEDMSQRLVDLDERMQANLSSFSDPLDKASSNEAIDRDKKLREKLKEQYSLVLKALAKDDDDYGVCAICLDDIEIPRIEVHPHIENCLSCQELKEVKEKQLMQN